MSTIDPRAIRNMSGPVAIHCPCGAVIRHCDACGGQLGSYPLPAPGAHTILDCAACGGTIIDCCQACGARVRDLPREGRM